MSGMNFLEKLLDGIEVEWRSFGEVAKVQRGASPRPISKYITDDRNGIPRVIRILCKGAKIHQTQETASWSDEKKNPIASMKCSTNCC
jgi:type I restriction enzyme, S subunit